MRYTKEMQIGKKQRRKKHKPSIIQRKDGRCYLCMLLNEDNGAKKNTGTSYIRWGKPGSFRRNWIKSTSLLRASYGRQIGSSQMPGYQKASGANRTENI